MIKCSYIEDVNKCSYFETKEEDIENVKFYQMDETDMKFKDRCFDMVSIALVLHETDEEVSGKLILEAKRVLKDDGEIIITEWEPSKL